MIRITYINLPTTNPRNASNAPNCNAFHTIWFFGRYYSWLLAYTQEYLFTSCNYRVCYTLSWHTNAYSNIILYLLLPQIGITLSAFTCAVIAIGLNSTAYISQIIKSGIQSIDAGQWQAAQVLGFSTWQTMRCIIMPQAFRVVIPALLNESITLIKDSSLASTIGVVELFKTSYTRDQYNVSTNTCVLYYGMYISYTYDPLINCCSLRCKKVSLC